MSRFAFFIVLLLVLAVSVSAFRFSEMIDIPASDLVNPAACPNMCSNNGDCVNGANSTSCICNDGFLGNDCSIKVTMNPVCWINNNVCSYWTIQNGYLYQRISALTANTAGWVGFMFGASDGMAGGQSTIFHVASVYTVVAEEMFSVQRGKPSLLPDQSISSSDVSGLAMSTGIVISYQRLADPKLARHYAIPTAAGTMTNISVAFSPAYFNFHMTNSAFIMIDLAAASLGEPHEPTPSHPPIELKKYIGAHRHGRSRAN